MLTPVSTFRIMWQYRDDLLRYNDNELHDDVYIHNHPDRPKRCSLQTLEVYFYYIPSIRAIIASLHDIYVYY